MRRGFALIWLAATGVVATIVGVFSYQAGVAAGLAAKLPAGAVAPYFYGPHFFGFFGLLPFLFLLLVLLFVLRGGRRWGRGWGAGPRGYGRYQGAAPPPGAPPPADDPWRDWPQRPPSEQPPSGQQQS